MILVLILITAVVAAEVENAGNGITEGLRDRSHIATVLGLHEYVAEDRKDRQEILDELSHIYSEMISPVELLYKFSSFDTSSITDAKIHAKPVMLVIGSWSTGKSTMINYLLGIENSTHALYTGAEPTTSEFTVISRGRGFRTVEGIVMTTDSKSEFAALETFGRAFLERLEGIEMPLELLDWVTIVDTPGIIENRRQQERGYPFNDVMKWFIDRAALILVMFDPSKLDVGLELESTFRQLKGRESQVRFVLNKADSIELQELMRVYGALFWNLSPLINVTEPPRVYVGSFHSSQFRGSPSNHRLFHLEEISLLQHLHDVIFSAVQNKVAVVRQHALRVLIHAEMVSAYIAAFERERSFIGDNTKIWSAIVANPERHNVYRHALEQMLSLPVVISKHDLPQPVLYQEFFRDFGLDSFKSFSKHCSYFSNCSRDILIKAIKDLLPQLLLKCQHLLSEEVTCDAGSESCRHPIVSP